jgi:dipeptidyl aminopeptidase/acylaminoacyl peptidase
MHRKAAVVCACLAVMAVSLPGAGHAATRVISLNDLPRIVNVSDVHLSPDGTQVVYVASRADMHADRWQQTLMLYDVARKEERPLTFERRGIASPIFSPDGGRIAFLALAGSGDDAHEQLFVMDMRGGDPIQVTHAPQGVQQFAWRPDGRALAYVTADEPANKALAARHLDAFVVGDQAFNERAAPTPNHLWLVNADGSGNRRLTEGTWSIPSAQPPSSPGPPISWSPDGTQIAFTRMPNAYDADSDLAVVAVLNVATGTIRTLTSHGKFEGYGEFSPDGSRIAYWYPYHGDGAAENDIDVAPATGGDGVDVTADTVDTNVVRAMWMPDGQSLLVAGHKGTDAALWIVPLAGAPRRLDLGAVQPVQAFWLDGDVSRSGAIAFAGSEPNHPVEVYYMASADAPPQRLTHNNDAIASLDLGAVHSLTWENEGFAEDGVVTLPPGYTSDKKYPLVLVIHGGPNSASITSFSLLNQLLAARGYIVFNPNYRGSDNLGERYWYGIVNDSGAGPGRDVMAGLAAVERAYPVDASRIAVSGWSYGGYMTSWLIGHYHVWKAAVSGAAVNDLIDEYALADNGVGWRYYMGGSPFTGNRLPAYIAQSPVSYAWQVTTPTLILSDVNDARVPITQSYKMYHALKDRGTRVEFWAYPVAGHFPSDPVREQDVFRRWIGWIASYLH